MTHRRKKLAKIIDELTIYFFAVGADCMQSGIKIDGRHAVIEFRANYKPEFFSQVKKVEEYLNEPKNEGIEDFYWELAGSGEPGETSQLLLVGMMIDRADIEIGETEVSLRLYKEMNEEI